MLSEQLHGPHGDVLVWKIEKNDPLRPILTVQKITSEETAKVQLKSQRGPCAQCQSEISDCQNSFGGI